MTNFNLYKKYITIVLIIAVLMASSFIATLPKSNVIASNSVNKQPTVFNYIIRDPNIVPGGTFRRPMLGEANTLNPWMFTTSWEAMILDVVYDPLTRLAPDGNIVGVLAKSWEALNNGLTYIFHLYENATWHDGIPVTAEDVAYTYLFLRDYGNTTRFSDYAPYIKDVKVLDKYTVEIDLTQPYAPFLALVTSSIYVVPKHIWANISPTEVPKFKNENPIGSGPFIFKEHVAQQYYMLVANPKYHLGRPYIDTLIYPVISNPDAMLLALKKGDVDVVTWSIPYASVADIAKDPNIRLWNVTELGARFMYFNCRRYPMNETLFRQAVHYALNLTEVVEIIYQGFALPGSIGRLPPVLQPWANPNIPPKEVKYPFNLTKAAELLDRLGIVDKNGDGWRDLPDGTSLKLAIYSPSYDPLRVRIGEILTNNLRKIGLNVVHQPLEWTTLVNKLNSGDFDMLIIGGIGSVDPDILRQLFGSKGSWNNGGCVIPGLDELLKKQAVTVDLEARKQLVWKIQEIIAEYVPLFNFVHQQFVFAYRIDKWAGWILDPIDSPDSWYSLMSLYNIELQKKPITAPKELIFTQTPSPTITTTTTPATTTTSPTTTTTPTTITTATTTPPSVATSTAAMTAVTTTVVVPTTIVSTVVSTVSSVSTATMTATTTVTQRVTEWTTTIAIAIVLLIIGFAIGWIMKRR
jgi:peptide/nickel transport system substrate-binding protein